MLDPHKDEPGGTGLGLDRSQSISLEAPTRNKDDDQSFFTADLI